MNRRHEDFQKSFQFKNPIKTITKPVHLSEICPNVVIGLRHEGISAPEILEEVLRPKTKNKRAGAEGLRETWIQFLKIGKKQS